MNPELTLWRAVIAQALADVESRCSSTGHPDDVRARWQAREWFKTPRSWDFTKVCEMADIHPDRLFDRYLHPPRHTDKRRRNRIYEPPI